MHDVATSYYLSWKGRQTGPFTLEQIRTQLTAAEISRAHQIGVGGGWQLLDEFLSRLPEEKAAREAAANRPRLEDRGRREQMPAGHVPRPLSSEASDEAGEEPSLKHLIPQPLIFPAPSESSGNPEPAPFPEDLGPTRTSGLAVACLVLAFGCFIPFVQLISWLLALIFGHTALHRMKRDPGLGGRGLAITGLVITYFLLVMGVTFLSLFIYHGIKLPEYYRL